MNYYKIVDVKPASAYGVIPQSQRMTEGYNYLAPNSVRNIPSKEKIECIPNFDAIQLNYRAKLTDWISSINVIPSWIYLILSEKLSGIILSYKMPKELQSFNAYVVKRKKKYNYKCLYSYNLNKQIVNYEKSQFAIVDDFYRTKIQATRVANLDELYAKQKEMKGGENLTFEKVVLNQNRIDTDFFRLMDGVASGYYVSERLKNAIQEAECTGIAFQSVEELNWVKE